MTVSSLVLTLATDLDHVRKCPSPSSVHSTRARKLACSGVTLSSLSLYHCSSVLTVKSHKCLPSPPWLVRHGRRKVSGTWRRASEWQAAGHGGRCQNSVTVPALLCHVGTGCSQPSGVHFAHHKLCSRQAENEKDYVM